MNHASTRRGQVDIFNFSFLDILACVIGLLIFILAIIVISGAGAVERIAKKQSSQDQSADISALQTRLAELNSRRILMETRLLERARANLDPEHTADQIRREIASLTNDNDILTRQLSSRTAELRQKQENGQIESDAGKQKAAIERIKNEIAGILTETDKLKRELPKLLEKQMQQVDFYTPRLTETSRGSVLLELDKGLAWVINDDNYSYQTLNEDHSRASRRPGVRGAKIDAWVAGREAVPAAVSRRIPVDTVIVCAVRPDSYVAFRQLREWAWKHKYAVHWIPMESDEAVIVTSSGRRYQQ